MSSLHYTSVGRSGTVRYVGQGSSFELWWEFAGGDALAIIAVPSEDEWEAKTKLPQAARTATLEWIGEQLVKDNTHGQGRYECDDRFITLYRRSTPS